MRAWYRRDMSMRWIALATSIAVAACGDDGPTTGPPAVCELVVAAASECPSVGTICTGHCGAVHDCCYPIGDAWGDVITDCDPCPDAGLDAP